jgi:quercetin 2,3-dioxygenase
MHQDADLYLCALEPSSSVQHAFTLGRHGWLQVVSGKVRLNDFTFHAGDGAAVSDELAITVQAVDEAEFMLFDLP